MRAIELFCYRENGFLFSNRENGTRMVERLIEVLTQIETNPDIRDYEEHVIPTENPGLQEANILANCVLISSHGDIEYDMVEILREHGYSVFPIERDRFGWLVGGIRTKKGIITFG